jgi:hypothetical protein
MGQNVIRDGLRWFGPWATRMRDVLQNVSWPERGTTTLVQFGPDMLIPKVDSTQYYFTTLVFTRKFSYSPKKQLFAEFSCSEVRYE